VDDAIDFARSYGVIIEEDVRFVVRDDVLAAEEDAHWGGWKSTDTYRWEDLLIRGKIVVKLRSTVLGSDEGILCVFAHEMHEINGIRTLFEESEDGTLPGARLIYLTEPGRKNLHDEAWDVGDALVGRLRRERARQAEGGE